MKTLKVHSNQGVYDIYIGEHILSILDDVINPMDIDSICIVTDSNTEEFLPKFFYELKNLNIPISTVSFSAGEENKNPETLLYLLSEFANKNLTRHSLLIALGGGVVGDITGFAASVYMRGISFIQIPTTLMAMVDSSVGGKTGVDLPEGKNLIGSFYSPKAVIADVSFLKSLPDREVKAGLAEVVKYVGLGVKSLYEPLLSMDYEEIIYQSCKKKADVVTKDFLDNGERQFLNFGHTFAHAIEKYYKYTRLNHGEAVAIGIRLAIEAGISLGFTDVKCKDYFEELFSKLGISTKLEIPVIDIIPLMVGDKKNTVDAINLILLKDIGEPRIVPITEKRLKEIFR
ncbi:MAG: 3-dehydroquinate synthase [Lachnospiraceae bacterium]|jgi:3-dehydroquinate synthase|nr:3-dehydroquinate synthase [Lachnospiraceae bacterium]